MAPPLSDVLAHLEQAAEELNTELDTLNETLEGIEDRLDRAGIGVAYWLDSIDLLQTEWIEPEGDRNPYEPADRYFEAWRIGYAKLGNKWRIATRKVRVLDTPDGDETTVDGPIPLASANRNTRIEAASQIEALCENLLQQLRAKKAGMQKAKAALDMNKPTSANVKTSAAGKR